MINNKINKLFKIVLKACQDMKGLDLSAIDLNKAESYADYIVLVSGSSDRQVRAITDRVVEDAYRICKVHPLGIEGMDKCLWVLIDFGDVICHVFLQEIRDFYHLEDMWPLIKPLKEDDLKGYFKRPGSKAVSKRKLKKCGMP